jgi:hypothetical protein
MGTYWLPVLGSLLIITHCADMPPKPRKPGQNQFKKAASSRTLMLARQRAREAAMLAPLLIHPGINATALQLQIWSLAVAGNLPRFMQPRYRRK